MRKTNMHTYKHPLAHHWLAPPTRRPTRCYGLLFRGTRATTGFVFFVPEKLTGSPRWGISQPLDNWPVSSAHFLFALHCFLPGTSRKYTPTMRTIIISVDNSCRILRSWQKTVENIGKLGSMKGPRDVGILSMQHKICIWGPYE